MGLIGPSLEGEVQRKRSTQVIIWIQGDLRCIRNWVVRGHQKNSNSSSEVNRSLLVSIKFPVRAMIGESG